jgi:multidrug efflux pump
MNFNLTEWAIRRRSLVIYFMLVVVMAGVGSYLWLGRSEGPESIFRAIGIVLGVSLVAEEIIRLRDCRPRRNPSVETKGKVDA